MIKQIDLYTAYHLSNRRLKWLCRAIRRWRYPPPWVLNIIIGRGQWGWIESNPSYLAEDTVPSWAVLPSPYTTSTIQIKEQ